MKISMFIRKYISKMLCDCPCDKCKLGDHDNCDFNCMKEEYDKGV